MWTADAAGATLAAGCLKVLCMFCGQIFRGSIERSRMLASLHVAELRVE